MSVITLFASQVGDATSSAGRVRPVTGNTKIERVMFRGSGTFGDAILAVQVSDNNVTWQPPTDSSGYSIHRYATEFSSLVDLPSGMYFRAVISDNGSPVSSTLSCRVFGDVLAA
jgi:hypothetical protein